MSTKASNCPLCGVRIYKPDGCNHMSCSRCKGVFCWICRRDITTDHYSHFDETRLFGCNGLTMMDQNVCGWIAVLLLQLLISPFAVWWKMAYQLGKWVSCCYDDGHDIQNPFFFVFYIFGVGALFMPPLLVLFAAVFPVVFIYRLYVVLMIVLRNFLCCCCC